MAEPAKPAQAPPLHGAPLALLTIAVAFATIPAQNATGNWIKVVQRVPVRIELDAAELAARPLQVGLSMTATIDTRSDG